MTDDIAWTYTPSTGKHRLMQGTKVRAFFHDHSLRYSTFGTRHYRLFGLFPRSCMTVDERKAYIVAELAFGPSEADVLDDVPF